MRKLRPTEDAYGQEIWAYYNDKDVAEIVENADGYISASMFGPKGYFSDYEDWAPPHEKGIGICERKSLRHRLWGWQMLVVSAEKRF
jgi:hypothetical protein